MKILVLPGDGIGPEITDATLAVLDCANAKFKLDLYANIRGSLARARQSAPAEPTGLATNC
jgi:isocitrate/isopropylmalate dehydrogenase